MEVDSYKGKIEKFVKLGNYHAAINTALSGLNACRREDDQVCVDIFVGIIKDISLTLAQEFASKEYLDNE